MKYQDRLLAQEQCLPALEIVRASLLGLSAGLFVALGLLFTLPQPPPVLPADVFKQTVGGYS